MKSEFQLWRDSAGFIEGGEADALLLNLIEQGLSGKQIYEEVRMKGIWIPQRILYVIDDMHFDARAVAKTKMGIRKLKVRISRENDDE